MRHAFLFTQALLLSGCIHLCAQTNTDYDYEVPEQARSIPTATIKLNLPCLMDPFRRSLFVATDIRIADRWSIDVGGGWFFAGIQEWREESVAGLRARLGGKYFYKLTDRVGAYAGLEGKYNLIYADRWETVCRFGCQYEETMLVRETHNIGGAALKTGLELFIGKKKQLMFDFYGGVGFKVIKKTVALPADGELMEAEEWFMIDPTHRNKPSGRYTKPDVILGVYFGYCFYR